MDALSVLSSLDELKDSFVTLSLSDLSFKLASILDTGLVDTKLMEQVFGKYLHNKVYGL